MPPMTTNSPTGLFFRNILHSIKVINAMIHPRFTRIGESYFNKFDSGYIKFVYLETVYPMNYFNKEAFDKNIDYIQQDCKKWLKGLK